MNGAAGLGGFISFEALSVFFAVLAFQVSSKNRRNSQNLSEAVLFASILCLILTLLIWYRAGDLNREAISIATTGIVYGLLGHVIIYVSAHVGSNDPGLDVGKSNWHWLEVSAFMVFMLFAPETIREYLVNEQGEMQEATTIAQYEERIEELESKVQSLEVRD